MSQDANTGRMYAGQPVEDRQRQRRARFLESGLTVFARDGYANSSVGAICKDAGLSSRQFYEEFTSRESLLLELYEQIDRESREAVEKALVALTPTRVSPVVIIDASVLAYIEYIGSDPRKARVALVEVVGATLKVEKLRLELRRVWCTLLAGALEDGALRGAIPTGDYEMRALAIIGAVNYVVDSWSVTDPRPALDDVTKVLSRVIGGAIGA